MLEEPGRTAERALSEISSSETSPRNDRRRFSATIERSNVSRHSEESDSRPKALNHLRHSDRLQTLDWCEISR